MNNTEKIKVLFEKLKKANGIYVRCSEIGKQKLIDGCQGIFKELEQLGVEKHFSESLLIFGKEFVDSFKTPTEPWDDTLQMMFGDPMPAPIIASPYGQINPTEPSRPATIEDAERIFGVKSVPLNDKEKREMDLAIKNGVIAWQSLPAPDGKVKIKALIEKDKLPLDK